MIEIIFNLAIIGISNSETDLKFYEIKIKDFSKLKCFIAIILKFMECPLIIDIGNEEISINLDNSRFFFLIIF